MSGKTSAKSKNKYAAKVYDRISLVVPKGKKEKIKNFAEKNGEKTNGYINRLIRDDMGEEYD